LLVILSGLMGKAPLQSQYSQGAPVRQLAPKFSRLDDANKPPKKSNQGVVYLTDKINTGNLQVYDKYGKSRLEALLLAFEEYNQGVSSSSAAP
jgi:hypothetical protein